MFNTCLRKAIPAATLLLVTGLMSNHSAAFAASDEVHSYSGVITDSMCGASHKEMHVSPETKCVFECVKAEPKNRYALFDGRAVYILSDQETPAKFAAQRVKITGQYFQATNVLRVDSIAPEH